MTANKAAPFVHTCVWCTNPPITYFNEHPDCYRHAMELKAEIELETARAHGLLEELALAVNLWHDEKARASVLEAAVECAAREAEKERLRADRAEKELVVLRNWANALDTIDAEAKKILEGK